MTATAPRPPNTPSKSDPRLLQLTSLAMLWESLRSPTTTFSTDLCLRSLCVYGASSVKIRTGTPSLDIRDGTANGLHLDDLKQDVFFSIPYVKPPVKSLRLRNPQVYDTAFGEEGLNATNYAWSCPQAGPLAVGIGAAEYQSEDCLTLNVVRPDTDHGDLPVLVRMHGLMYGGGYNVVTSSSPVYNLLYIVQEFVEMDHVEHLQATYDNIVNKTGCASSADMLD
ncbi:alpha/beta-hydrolase [Hymenopellis radicata]|nr:alpha/beta-hydrolase [Hymenopellis radicata]